MASHDSDRKFANAFTRRIFEQTQEAHPQGREGRYAGRFRSRDTEIGAQVTVTLEVIPDLHTLTVALLVPRINLGGGTERPLSTLAILTTHRTSIGSPDLIEGQLKTYDAVALEGSASLVQF